MSERIAAEAEELFEKRMFETYSRTDRLFAYLMMFQWGGAILLAWVVSPRTWSGELSQPHIHLYAAFILGGLLTLMPAFLAFKRPGEVLTRHTIVICQVLFSALLIHLTGGRIETHFHLFGSFAFIAFYKDWKLLITATLVAAVDHLIRGVFWPQSIFGVISASEWRVVEHAAWLLFEVIILVKGCLHQTNEVRILSENQVNIVAEKEKSEQALIKAEEARKETLEVIGQMSRTESYLSRNVNKMLDSMKRFSKGDLTVHLEPEVVDDEVGQLFEGFNEAIQNIREMLNEVLIAVSETRGVSAEISGATEQLVLSAKKQTHKMLDISSAVEEMSSTIRNNTRISIRTAEVATQNGETAHQGSEIVEQAVGKIHDIANIVKEATEKIEHLGISSQKIGDIITVIEDIAEQTNLLALNAAIEAARAGEQGRGFAIVADEVRKLAERTSASTMKIAAMVKSIQDETQHAVQSMHIGDDEMKMGIHLTDQAGKALMTIVNETDSTIQLIKKISSASEEQSATSAHISKRVEAISMMSAEASGDVVGIAESAMKLNQHMETLDKVVSRFVVDSKVHTNSTVYSD